MTSTKIYLAGPDVFRTGAGAHFECLKSMAAQKNIEAISPFDSESSPATAREIFEVNIRILHSVNAVFANLTPFRGPGVDDGTAFEIGYAFALGLKIYGYSATAKSSYEIITEMYPAAITKEFPVVENFGHTCNLMIAEAIIKTNGVILSSYEECLDHYSAELERKK